MAAQRGHSAPKLSGLAQQVSATRPALPSRPLPSAPRPLQRIVKKPLAQCSARGGTPGSSSKEVRATKKGGAKQHGSWASSCLAACVAAWCAWHNPITPRAMAATTAAETRLGEALAVAPAASSSSPRYLAQTPGATAPAPALLATASTDGASARGSASASASEAAGASNAAGASSSSRSKLPASPSQSYSSLVSSRETAKDELFTDDAWEGMQRCVAGVFRDKLA